MAGEGLTLDELGARFRVSCATIRKRLLELGIDTSRKRALDKPQRVQVTADYMRGEGVRPNSVRFGVSTPAIRAVLTDACIRMRSSSQSIKVNTAHNKRNFSRAEEDRIHELWSQERLKLTEIG